MNSIHLNQEELENSFIPYSGLTARGHNVQFSEMELDTSKMLYDSGIKFLKKRLNPLPFFEEASKNGHYKSSYMIGKMYEYGDVVKRDFKRAFQYYNKAIDDGDYYKAYKRLGKFYYQGIGVTQNDRKALTYLSQYKNLRDLHYRKNSEVSF